MRKEEKQRAIITVVGVDAIGIVAAVTSLLAANRINILEITQTTLSGIFTMAMLVDLERSTVTIADLSDRLKKLGKKIGQEIDVQDEKIIRAMHRI